MPGMFCEGTFRPAAARCALPGGERRIDFRVAAHRRDLELHSELIRETPRQFVFRTLRHIVRAAVIGERPVARDHAQFPESLDLVDQARQRGAGAQQSDGRHRDDDFGPALPIDGSSRLRTVVS